MQRPNYAERFQRVDTARTYSRTSDAFPGSEPGSVQGPYRRAGPATWIAAFACGLLGVVFAVHVVLSIVRAAP